MRSITLLLALGSATPALAQNFDFQVSSAQSTTDLVNDFTADLPGEVIGNFDPVSNPTGTRTLPGLFGGSGNQPVSLDVSLVGTSTLSGTPTGAFFLAVDTNALTVDLSALDLDLLGGAPGALDLDLILSFDTFRTFDPDSLFIGGIPLPIPLASATIADVVVTQTGPAAGVLVPDAMVVGRYDFVLAVPADLSFNFDFMSMPTAVGPVPSVLPVIGVLDIGPGGAQVSISVDQMMQQTLLDPAPGLAIDDVPLPLPTILPPGGIANLLYDATIASIDILTDTAFDLVADGTTSGCGAIVSYCSTTPNSIGPGALMSSNGMTSVGANAFELIAGPVPPEPGIFFYGADQAAGGAGAPFGNGLRCVGTQGGQVYRLLVTTPIAGEFRYTFDLSAPPLSGAAITPSSTWNFQCWYRDPSAGGAGFNLSDGLEVSFCP